MNELDDNPYLSPVESIEKPEARYSMVWQRKVAWAVRLAPFALVIQGILFILNAFSGEGGLVGLFIEISLTLLLWFISLVYHGWFGALLYGVFWGIVLAPVASFPIVGQGLLAMFYIRASRELRASGWRVHWFSTQSPDETP